LWSELETPNVLAALALERNEVALATRILDLDSTIVCPHCGLSFEIREGFRDEDEDLDDDWTDI
jgi:rubredoxin